MSLRSLSLSVLAALAFQSGQVALAADTNPAANAFYQYDEIHQPVLSKTGMVSTQDLYASEVGAEILRRGGNAVDAAVAVGFALAVTHPQAGNLGGGGFLMLAAAAGAISRKSIEMSSPSGAA
ncbi:MAG: gamma-glutamyltransferase, partial [Pseudomonadota bacterium]